MQQMNNVEQNRNFIEKIGNIIFGSKAPDSLTKVSFYISLLIWFMFFIWSLLSFGAIYFRETIQNEKQIPVSDMINERGIELGFDSGSFVDRLLVFHSISLVAWFIVFIGIVLIWRKVSNYIYFFFGGTSIYLLTMLFYLNFDYYLEDTTFFDKIAFIALNLVGLINTLLAKSETNLDSKGLFDEVLQDE
jgi:hypothetical protein